MKKKIKNTQSDICAVWTIEEAMAVLNLSRCLVYDLINQKELHSIKCGRRRLVPKQAMQDYLMQKSMQ